MTICRLFVGFVYFSVGGVVYFEHLGSSYEEDYNFNDCIYYYNLNWMQEIYFYLFLVKVHYNLCCRCHTVITKVTNK